MVFILSKKFQRHLKSKHSEPDYLLPFLVPSFCVTSCYHVPEHGVTTNGSRHVRLPCHTSVYRNPVIGYENRFSNLFFKLIFPIKMCLSLNRNNCKR